MPYRAALAAFCILACSSMASAQQAPPAPPPAAAEEPADDGPIGTADTSESVTVTGTRRIESTRPVLIEQRQRHQAESRCLVAEQGAADPLRPQLDTPEDVCLRSTQQQRR